MKDNKGHLRHKGVGSGVALDHEISRPPVLSSSASSAWSFLSSSLSLTSFYTKGFTWFHPLSCPFLLLHCKRSIKGGWMGYIEVCGHLMKKFKIINKMCYQSLDANQISQGIRWSTNTNSQGMKSHSKRGKWRLQQMENGAEEELSQSQSWGDLESKSLL